MAKAINHLIKYLRGFDTAQTQTTPKERDAIRRNATGKRRAVEIGVFERATTNIIATSLSPGAEFFAIDPFAPGRMGICWGKPIAHREALRNSPRCAIQFVEKFSHKAHSLIPGEFDFVFVHGDHSIEGIAQDWHD